MMAENSTAIGGFISFKQHNQGRSSRTIEKYEDVLAQLANYLGDLPLASASYENLAEFTGPHLHAKRLIPRSRKVYIACIRGFYAWLTQIGRIKENPAAQLVPPKAGCRLPEGMTNEQVEKLLMAPGFDSFIGLRDTVILMFLFGAGLRVSELRHLNQEDLIFEGGGSREPESLILAVRSAKGGRDRVVPAPDLCVYAARAYLGHPEMMPGGSIDRSLPSGERVLFVSTNNRAVPRCNYFGESRRLSSFSIYRIVQRYSQKCGFPVRIGHPHALRHAYATQLIENGADLIHVQENLGHASPETTRIYTQLAIQKRREVIKRHSPFIGVRTPFDGLRDYLVNEHNSS
ncbi:MAG: tyrosine-type recombinase/integrase [Gammaproteobacteria bacterium]